MTWSTVRNEMQSVLAGVSGIGQVHNRMRKILNDRDLAAVTLSGGVINGWFHTRIGTSVDRQTNVEDVEQHAWLIQGYYSFNDATNSEATFQALIEAIRVIFRSLPTLNSKAEVISPVEMLENKEPHVLIPPGDGGKLCHFVELRTVITERVAR